MKVKLDENIGGRGIELLNAAGHDVMTVRDQGLQGARDDTIFNACAGEGRILITLDHDFGQVLRFPPKQSAGLVILEPWPRMTHQSLLDRLRDFLALAEVRSPWVRCGSWSLDGSGFIYTDINKGFVAGGREKGGYQRSACRMILFAASGACATAGKCNGGIFLCK